MSNLDRASASVDRFELVQAAIDTAEYFDSRVFPGISRSKTPPKGFKRWPKRAARTPADIRALFDRYPNADAIALVIPAGWVVIDEEYVGALKASGFHIPAGALIAQSPGSKVPGHRGMHAFVRTRGTVRDTPDNRATPRYIELRGPGSYVIVPPDKGRHWIIGPGDVDVRNVPYAPAWVDRLAQSKSSQARRRRAATLNPDNLVSQRMRNDRQCATELGVTLTNIFMDERYLAEMLPLCGIPNDRRPGDGRPFLCPYCQERRPSASLWRSDNQQIVIRCWHAGGGKHQCPATEWSLLPESFAFQQRGEFQRLEGPELAAWSLRLLRDAQIAKPKREKIHLPGLSYVARRVIHALAEVMSLADALGAPASRVAFTRRFASAYLDLPVQAVARAWTTATKLNLVVAAGNAGIVRLWTFATWVRSTSQSSQRNSSITEHGIGHRYAKVNISLDDQPGAVASITEVTGHMNGPPEVLSGTISSP